MCNKLSNIVHLANLICRHCKYLNGTVGFKRSEDVGITRKGLSKGLLHEIFYRLFIFLPIMKLKERDYIIGSSYIFVIEISSSDGLNDWIILCSRPFFASEFSSDEIDFIPRNFSKNCESQNLLLIIKFFFRRTIYF